MLPRRHSRTIPICLVCEELGFVHSLGTRPKGRIARVGENPPRATGRKNPSFPTHLSEFFSPPTSAQPEEPTKTPRNFTTKISLAFTHAHARRHALTPHTHTHTHTHTLPTPHTHTPTHFPHHTHTHTHMRTFRHKQSKRT